MIFFALSVIALVVSGATAALFYWNLWLYREPPIPAVGAELPAISVLIPARNEEGAIAAAVESILKSERIQFELIVLDDASTDRTPEMLRGIAARLENAGDTEKLRVESAPALPPGWNGKQHACWVLAQMASHPVLCFLDADVRVSVDALARMASYLELSSADLVSGFPQEETGTWLEELLLPLIHFVLLGFLPLWAMRKSKEPGYAAGCGQFMMVRRGAYFEAGGHAAIRATMHDGLLLPRLLRNYKKRTDLADLSRLARCHMYRSAGEVWRGLSKNATEGLAAPARIVPFTLLLFCGQILPLILILAAVTRHGTGHQSSYGAGFWVAIAALFASYLPRLLAASRFRQSLMGALFHPIGVAVLLMLQWQALAKKLLGVQAHWKQRAYDLG